MWLLSHVIGACVFLRLPNTGLLHSMPLKANVKKNRFKAFLLVLSKKHFYIYFMQRNWSVGRGLKPRGKSHTFAKLNHFSMRWNRFKQNVFIWSNHMQTCLIRLVFINKWLLYIITHLIMSEDNYKWCTKSEAGLSNSPYSSGCLTLAMYDEMFTHTFHWN